MNNEITNTRMFDLVREMRKWSKGEGEYDDVEHGFNARPIPSSPRQYGADIDALIAFAEGKIKNRKVKK